MGGSARVGREKTNEEKKGGWKPQRDQKKGELLLKPDDVREGGSGPPDPRGDPKRKKKKIGGRDRDPK